MLVKVKLNNVEYEADSSLTILQLAKQHGIKIPTLCYFVRDESNFEHKPASCRVCVCEVKGKRALVPACATNIYDGMEVFTNNKRVREERKAIVELLLSNHPKDCLSCEKSGNCALQDLAIELDIRTRSFEGPLSQEDKDVTHESLKKNASKCVLCTRCIDVCENIQGIGAISASQRGFKTIISETNNCVNCGQCVQVCPTGALLQVDDTAKVEEALADPTKYVVIHSAPSVRVTLGEEFGLKPGTDVTHKMVSALRMLGFDKVFDTNFGADLTIMEEAKELVTRLTEKKNLPMITSCCPGWIGFIETQYPELLNLPSTCKSPQEMFGSIVKTYFANKEGIDPKNIVVVSLMPCIAKKQELLRDELKLDGMHANDYSVSVKELARMLKRYGIDLPSLEDGEFDNPLGTSTGAADIFGNAGGVMEAALRTASMWLTNTCPDKIDFKDVPNTINTKEATVTLNGTTLNVAYVSGLKNARKLLDDIKNGNSHYDFIEVMACPGGCIAGGGQPVTKGYTSKELIELRRQGIINIDVNKKVRVSCENEDIKKLYNDFLVEPNSKTAHHILHTHYTSKVK
ncbi:MAG: NADH-dependent [FeFe] hydrogenase, group A6 [Candidatus Caccosoma sp.]|nr:NADH-dependent [FeFe] hydrogenase, group A6 [Candidatus Caccosoma sp.]